MATVTETMGDAAASVDTTYSMAVGDTFSGRLNERFDEDWIRIELVAGRRYEIKLTGNGADGAADTILRIYNAAGVQVSMNDDVDFAAGNLHSMVSFTPDSSGVYYVGAASYTGNPSQANWGDYSVTVSNPGDSDPMEEESGDGESETGQDDEVLEEESNMIEGTDGADVMTGTEGDDAFQGTPGADTIRGGPGNDIVLYLTSDDGVEVRVYDGIARGGDAEGDTFPGRQIVDYVDAEGSLQQAGVPDIEAFAGSVHDDILAGAQGPNLLLGGPGNDELDGREGNDVLDGGPGGDVLIGGPGNDTASYEYSFGVHVNLDSGEIRGGDAGGDTFPGRQVIEYVDEEGNLQQAEVPDIENLRGSEYGDVLTGTHGPNRLEGLDGSDSLYGLGGNDELDGGSGPDKLKGDAGNDQLDGGLHDDSIEGGAGNDELHGGPGDDVLEGGAGNDELDGGEGADELEGGAGADRLRGGAGIDIADYWSSEAGVEINLHDGTARGGDAEGDTFVGQQTIEYMNAEGNIRQAVVYDIENLYGSEHADILIGDIGPNELYGNDGDDVLEGREGDDRLIGDRYIVGINISPRSTRSDDKLNGGAGDDWLEGGGGADQLRGGPGEDTASYRVFSSAVEVRLYDGTARGGQAEGDTFVGRQTMEYIDDEGNTQRVEVPDIENLLGSSGNDILAGAHGPNRLDGAGGNDRLFGREGDDWLEGGSGRDSLEGGPGADVLRGGADIDIASYESSNAGVVVRLHTVLEQGGKGGDAEGDTYNGETYTVTNDDGTNREVEVPDIRNLFGSEHNDVLAGDIRENRIYGQGGDDLLFGGPDGGPDVLFGGDGDDKVYGGKGRDKLYGGPGDDLLRGGPDNDVLDYVAYTLDLERSTETDIHVKRVRHDYGNDQLEGGAGDDYFYFYPDGGNDIILDFGNGEDKIVLTAFEEIQSVDDLTLQQQGDNLVIDLSAQGGDTITLLDFNEANILETHFDFFTDDSATAA